MTVTDPLHPAHVKALIKRLIGFSDRIYAAHSDCMMSFPDAPNREYYGLFVRMLRSAEDTSRAAATLAEQGLHIPLLALMRVRLEQAIVCSYLIHEKVERGLLRFSKHVSVQDYFSAKDLLEDSTLKEHGAGQLNLAQLQADALAAAQEVSPDFDPETGKLKRKWTDLTIENLAKTRDELAVKQGTPLALMPLKMLYTAAYRPASSIVHSDASSISFPFTKHPPKEGFEPTIVWPFIAMVYTVNCDLVQCFEVSEWSRANAARLFQAIISDFADFMTT